MGQIDPGDLPADIVEPVVIEDARAAALAQGSGLSISQAQQLLGSLQDDPETAD